MTAFLRGWVAFLRGWVAFRAVGWRFRAVGRPFAGSWRIARLEPRQYANTPIRIQDGRFALPPSLKMGLQSAEGAQLKVNNTSVKIYYFIFKSKQGQRIQGRKL